MFSERHGDRFPFRYPRSMEKCSQISIMVAKWFTDGVFNARARIVRAPEDSRQNHAGSIRWVFNRVSQEDRVLETLA